MQRRSHYLPCSTWPAPIARLPPPVTLSGSATFQTGRLSHFEPDCNITHCTRSHISRGIITTSHHRVSTPRHGTVFGRVESTVAVRNLPQKIKNKKPLLSSPSFPFVESSVRCFFTCPLYLCPALREFLLNYHSPSLSFLRSPFCSLLGSVLFSPLFFLQPCCCSCRERPTHKCHLSTSEQSPCKKGDTLRDSDIVAAQSVQAGTPQQMVGWQSAV